MLQVKPTTSVKRWVTWLEDTQRQVPNAPRLPKEECHRYKVVVVREFGDLQLRRASVPPSLTYKNAATELYRQAVVEREVTPCAKAEDSQPTRNFTSLSQILCARRLGRIEVVA